MHWFWRGGIGVCAGLIAFWLALTVLQEFIPPNRLITGWLSLATALIAAIKTYAFVDARYGLRAKENETRCRRCNYILRGITEPRCPECGERI